MGKQIIWILFALLAIGIGGYPAMYLIGNEKFGILQSKPAELLENIFWNTAFYIHIVLGGIALLIGWLQFISKLRQRKIRLHRLLGKIYVSAALVSSVAGICIGFFANGGFISSLGFICLGLCWLSTTLAAYINIRKGKIQQHQMMMIYSYSVCFAAVTLRLWLPLLIEIFNKFETAYRIVSWLCWVPNLFFGYWMVKRVVKKASNTSTAASV